MVVELLGPVRSLDRFQRTHAPLAIPVAVLRNFSEQGAGNAAALVAFWGFFSLFPLLLVFTAVLGFVLQGDPSAQHSVVHSWPGIAAATLGWTVLQSVGGLYINHVVKGDGQTYGTFATVIGLLTWLYVGARIVVYAAEINVVLTRRLWPRSILEAPAPGDAVSAE